MTLSSVQMDFRTPDWFLALVRCVGPIECDPATGPDNPTGARVFFDGTSPARCGLRNEWPDEGLSFVNPRYGRFLSGPVDPEGEVYKDGDLVGVGTGWAARIAMHGGESIVLVPVRTETDWWMALDRWCSWKVLWSSPWFGRRIGFVDPTTGRETRSSNIASAVFYRGPRPARFLEVFGPHGTPSPGVEILRRYLRAVGPAAAREPGADLPTIYELADRDLRLAALVGR